MTRALPSLDGWLGQIGPSAAIEALTDMFDCGVVYAIDGAGQILFWSRGAERLLGFEGSAVIGRDCRDILRCEQPESLCGIAEKVAIQGQALEIETAGGRIRVRRSGRAFFDDQGRFAGALEVLWPETGMATAHLTEDDETLLFHGIITKDRSMKQACRVIANVAVTDATVLVRGETGSGKELVARAIHAESLRRDKPFLAVNCAAITPTLLESELFGHVRGAFTGAVKDHAGVFQRANGGTLFLDEVAELPLELQAKLLRVLQERDFIPVGGDHAIRVDVRIVAATHRSLREQAQAGRFREDLMYRLRVVPIFLPPLRQRQPDIGLLLWHFIDLHNGMGRRRVIRVEPEAMRMLTAYPWPGNVRELQNVVEYAFAVGRDETLRLDELPPEFREERSVTGVPQPTAIAPLPDEKTRIRQALTVTNGKVEEAAELLGMSRATFWRKRKAHGL
jgi:transcriptional regulator with PAS, ATPase and Fis domain